MVAVDLSDRGRVDDTLQKKIIVTARVPKYVQKYANDHKISISQLLMAGFDTYRENDLAHAFERLTYHEERTLHWKQKVIHAESETNTKQALCITIKETFIEQGRGTPETRKMDKNWLEPRIRDLQSKGIPITLDELYEFCVTPDRNNGGNTR